MPRPDPPQDPTVDMVADPIDRGLAAAFGPDSSPSRPGVRDSLTATLGTAFRVMLRDTDPAADPPLLHPTSSQMPGGGDGATGRYQLFGEIARGGMGAVLKGRDPDLGRELAVKVLLDAHRDKPELVRRFVEEAQIAGQLQHPGIVPVYELGVFADRRPFFAMKLVKGRTLAAILKGRASPSRDLPRLLGIFESICHTVAYAHARGVIHRDLKPSNVMVGSFGEVQVMDWGLAKVLARGGAADDAAAGMVGGAEGETVIATARSGGGGLDLSRAGSIMGTPAYMAPEQARGEVERLDERADVFALGSILCEVLTGEPAFQGRNAVEILGKAKAGATGEALDRLRACRQDAELIDLAGQCLAVEPEGRPRDAGAVTAIITAHLAGVREKLRSAEIAGAAASARAEQAEATARAEVRARRLTAALAASVVVLVAVGGGGYAWIEGQRAARLARIAHGVDEALAETARLRGEAAAGGDPSRWREALAAAKRAEDLVRQGEAGASLKARVAEQVAQVEHGRDEAERQARRLRVDRDLLADLEAIRGAYAEHDDAKRIDDEYAAAFRKAGLDLDATDPAAAGGWIAGRSDPVEMAAHLDHWAEKRRLAKLDGDGWRKLVAASRAADPDPWRDALRAELGSKEPTAFRRLADDAKALDAQPAASLVLLARQLKATPPDRVLAEKVLRRAWARSPGDFWVNFELAFARGPNDGEAKDLFPNPEHAVRYLTAAIVARPRSTSPRICLGFLFISQEKADEAVAEFREAIRVDPGKSGVRSILGKTLVRQGKVDEALAFFREAIRLEPRDPELYIGLGVIRKGQGKSDEALAAFREALRLQPDNVWAHVHLSEVWLRRGKLDEAFASCRQALRLGPGLAQAHLNMARTLAAMGRREEAVAEFREALRIEPGRVEAHTNLGILLLSLGRADEAVAAQREAVRLAPQLAEVHLNLGAALNQQGKLDEAIAACREAIRLQPNLSEAYANLGNGLFKRGEIDEAIAAHRRAIVLAPGDVDSHFYLGNELLVGGRHEEALDAYRRAIRLQPDHAWARKAVGQVLGLRGDYEGALAELRRARDADPARWPGIEQVPGMIRAMEVKSAVAARLASVLGGNDQPKDAAEAVAFAQVCYDRGRGADSARFYRAAFAADPKLVESVATGHRYNAACSAALAGCGRGNDDPPLDAAAQSRLRDQARDWLAADLVLLAAQVDPGAKAPKGQVRKVLSHWAVDPDLAGIRDAEALAKLPEPERKGWQALWADHEALLKKAGRP